MKNQHSARENGGVSVTKNLSVRGNFRKVEIFKSLHGQNRKKLNFRLLNRKLHIGQKLLKYPWKVASLQEKLKKVFVKGIFTPKIKTAEKATLLSRTL